MVPFSEKLSFLMRITETSNKALAAELYIDPSMVSLMRTGKRKLSKDPVQARKMAVYFAMHCPAAFQRRALSEVLGLVSISPSMPVGDLADCLERWLKGDNITDALLYGIQSLPAQMEKIQPASAISAATPSPNDQTLFFYGENGRRESLGRFIEILDALQAPSSVCLVVDDNLEWPLSDYPLSKKLQSSLIASMQRGVTFQQIIPPLNSINRYTESIHFWLPLYATGKMKVYYYPRLRSNLYRHSIVVVPGYCAQYAASVGSGNICDITMFTTDPKLMDALSAQFREHFSLCRPSLAVHQGAAETLLCLNDLFTSSGNTIQMVNALPVSTMPRAVLEQCIQDMGFPAWKQTFQSYMDHIPQFEAHLRQNTHIELAQLATAEDVRAGKVFLTAPRAPHPNHPCYTPETYILHLQNILRLMDEFENYYFVPMYDREVPDYNLYVSQIGKGLLTRTAPPFITLEMTRPTLATAFQEHLLMKAESVGFDQSSKEKVRMELRALIRELENAPPPDKT